MNPPGPCPRRLLVLLATASLLTTALLAWAISRRPEPAPTHDGRTTLTRLAAPQAAPRADAAAGFDPSLNPPALFRLPEFSLIERSGRPVGSSDLAGKAWIASFIFTRCAGACPAMTSRFYTIQEHVRQLAQAHRVRLVSVTVDPEHDQPAVLAERARIARADAELWWWLTGDKAAVWTLAREGFKLPVEDAPADPDMPIAHSQRFVLVDGQGRVRGYYEGLEETGVANLLADLRRVLEE